MKSQRSKATDISTSVKKKVWERDNHCCIYCGNPYAMPNAHYIPRSMGGLGIEQNVVTLCQRCHHNTDNTDMRPYMLEYIENYLRSKYPGWNKDNLYYKKGGYNEL